MDFYGFRENQLRFEREQAAYADRVRQLEWERAQNRRSQDATSSASPTLSPGEAGGCLIVALVLMAIVVVLMTPILWITLGLDRKADIPSIRVPTQSSQASSMASHDKAPAGSRCQVQYLRKGLQESHPCRQQGTQHRRDIQDSRPAKQVACDTPWDGPFESLTLKPNQGREEFMPLLPRNLQPGSWPRIGAKSQQLSRSGTGSSLAKKA